MAAGNVKGSDVFSIRVNRDAIVEGDDGKRAFRRRSHRSTACSRSALQPPPHILVRDDGGVFAEHFIAPGVIAVIVRVQNELDRLIGDAFQRFLDLWRQRRELVIDDHDAVFADRDADVASRSLQHIHGSGDLLDLDLHFAEITFLSDERHSEEGQGHGDQVAHGTAL